MNEEELKSFVELLYPFFVDKLKKDSLLKNIVKMKNATVVSIPETTETSTTNINQNIEVMLPYDTTSFTVLNKTGEELSVNDVVCIEYWIDLKNAVAKYKVN